MRQGLIMSMGCEGIRISWSEGGRVEMIDLSGGYGEQTIPWIAVYLEETNEWVIGEETLNFWHEGQVYLGKSCYKESHVFEAFINIIIQKVLIQAPHRKIDEILCVSLSEKIEEDIRKLCLKCGKKDQSILWNYAPCKDIIEDGQVSENLLQIQEDQWLIYNLKNREDYPLPVSLKQLDEDYKTLLKNNLQTVIDTSPQKKIFQDMGTIDWLFQKYKKRIYSATLRNKDLRLYIEEIYPPQQVIIKSDQLSFILDKWFKEIRTLLESGHLAQEGIWFGCESHKVFIEKAIKGTRAKWRYDDKFLMNRAAKYEYTNQKEIFIKGLSLSTSDQGQIFFIEEGDSYTERQEIDILVTNGEKTMDFFVRDQLESTRHYFTLYIREVTDLFFRIHCVLRVTKDLQVKEVAYEFRKL